MNYNRQIDIEEIQYVVNKAKLHKAIGIDCLPYEVMKCQQSCLLLHKLFNKMFLSCIIPEQWRKAILKPIPKNSTIDVRIPVQYRGIALLSTVYKLYASVLNNRLTSFLESENIYAEEQNGFRKKRSCLDHIFSLSTILKNRHMQKKSTYVAYLDAEKAFDRVDRTLFMYKLLMCGVNGQLYNNIKCIYNQTSYCINVNEMLTSWFDTECGVRQGDTLSPTLFGIFINDIVKEVNALNVGIDLDNEQISILLYADDIALISDTSEGLQQMLTVVDAWSKKWRVKFNAKKSNIVHYRNKKIPKTNATFALGDSILDIVPRYKYLGITLDEHVDFNITAKTLAEAGNRALGSIINKYKSINGLGYYTFTKLYKAGVCPILDYCSGVWGYNAFSCIDSIQNKAMRVFLGVHKFAPTDALIGDMGWTASITRRKLEICRLWNRLVKMDNDRLCKKVFSWDLGLNKRYTWSFKVKAILKDISMDNNFEQQTDVSLNTVWACLHDQYSQKWKANTLKSQKLRTYVTFKDQLKPESYVISFISKFQRSSIAQLRCGILPLAMETERWKPKNIRKPPDQRICLLCDINEPEDEFHFLFSCNKFSALREIFIKECQKAVPYFNNLDRAQKFTEVMEEKLIVPFSRFVSEIILMRRSIMYR